MIKAIRLAVLLFLVLLMPRDQAFAFRSIAVGETAPHVTVKDLESKDVRLPLGRRPVVLLFWRANQVFSLDALKDMERIRKEFAPRELEIFAVAEEGISPASAAETAKSLGLSYPVYLDSQRKIEKEYGVIVFPSTGIIGKDGRLKFYLPSRNSNYHEIVRGRLRVELGLASEKEFETQMRQVGEQLGSERLKAEEHLKIGLRLTRQGQGAEALREIKQAVDLDPELLDAHLALGYAYLEVKEVERARKQFEWVLSRHPNSPGAKVGIGISKIREGNVDEGIETLKEAVQLNPDPVQGYYELGKVYEKKNDLKEALHAYKWAVNKLLQGRR